MKLTEEQIEALQWLDQMRRKKFGASVFEALQEVVAILQKEQGIQWNNYPETEPNHTNAVLVFGRVDTKEGWYKAKLVGKTFWLADRDDLFDGYEVYDVTHWAEINLQNQ